LELEIIMKINKRREKINKGQKKNGKIYHMGEAYLSRLRDIFQNNTWQRTHSNHGGYHSQHSLKASPKTRTTEKA